MFLKFTPKPYCEVYFLCFGMDYTMEFKVKSFLLKERVSTQRLIFWRLTGTVLNFEPREIQTLRNMSLIFMDHCKMFHIYSSFGFHSYPIRKVGW